MKLIELGDTLKEVKSKLREKLKKQGLSEEQTEIKMNSLDCEFLTHCFVNGVKKETKEEGMEFYIKFLEIELGE